MPGNQRKRINNLCGAHARTTGKPCQMMAVKPQGRCRLHGGLSTGPNTPEGRRFHSEKMKRFNQIKAERRLHGKHSKS